MSNLGWYQKLTTASKAVGGPKILVGLLVGVGTVLGTGGTLLTQKVVNVVKSKKNSKSISYLESGKTYTISIEHKDKNGLELRVGDRYKVLESDGDSILIEKLGDSNNPYFVSRDLLKSISNFE